MNIIIEPSNKKIDDYVKAGINTFLLPLKDYSVEHNTYFSLDEIEYLASNYSDLDIYVSINKNIFNRELKDLEKILTTLNSFNIKGVFFYDIAILSIKNKLNLKFDLVWNQTFMVTNYKTCNYYNSKGVKYALLSKEITKDEIIEIINNTSISPIVELISMPIVAFSKRKLVTNYYKNYNLENKSSLEVLENKSKQKYILNEDINGTSFTLNKITNGCIILEELICNGLQNMLLKEDHINHDIFLELLKNIKLFLNNDINNKEFVKRQNELIGRNTNFFYRKTIYKVK